VLLKPLHAEQLGADGLVHSTNRHRWLVLVWKSRYRPPVPTEKSIRLSMVPLGPDLKTRVYSNCRSQSGEGHVEPLTAPVRVRQRESRPQFEVGSSGRTAFVPVVQPPTSGSSTTLPSLIRPLRSSCGCRKLHPGVRRLDFADSDGAHFSYEL
jgi:hypothetical protein